MSSDDSKAALPQKARFKRRVLARDRERCTNCRRPAAVVESLDVDHCVPRGHGGSELFSNNSTLCRQCHEAKNGHRLAPTVEVASTGRMTDYEFQLFYQFFDEMVPALADQVDVRLVPMFNIDDRRAWHLPVGDVKRLDKVLTDNPEYASFQLAEYM